MTSTKKRTFGVLGLGAAACAACCAAPVIGVVAATGLLTATGLARVGVVGLLVVVPGLVLIARRRARPSTCTPANEPVAVAPPSRRGAPTA